MLIRTEGNVQRDRFFPAREAETHLLGCLGGSVTLPIVPDIEITRLASPEDPVSISKKGESQNRNCRPSCLTPTRQADTISLLT